MARRKTKDEIWPRVTEGNHTKVIEFEDGRIEMVTDWAALNEEINLAIASLDSAKPKRTKKIRE
jgi:hypothetical protein